MPKYPLGSVLYLLLPDMDLNQQQSGKELCVMWSVVLALLLDLLADDWHPCFQLLVMVLVKILIQDMLCEE